MQSKRKLAPVVGRDGISGVRGNTSGREQEVPLVEIDATFARTLGLSDGQKVTASIHTDFPLAHTINIEPLTAEDWEIIELHATFLELNLMNQIRALPNPNYAPSSGPKPAPHPITIHLSPTSTANIVITSLVPEPPATSPFAKIAQDAEVIVAPKTRTKPSRASGENRSVSSRKSAGGRSGASTVRRRSGREDSCSAMFFRGLDRSLCREWFEDNRDAKDQGLKVWVDRDILQSKSLKGVNWVSVAVVKPASLQAPVDPQKQQQEVENLGEAGKIAPKVVARLVAWDDPPDSHHIALSSALCAAMICEGIVGGVVKLEPAPQQMSKAAPPTSKDSASQPTSKANSQIIKVYPFALSTGKAKEGLKFGGESKSEREEAGKRIAKMYGKQSSSEGVLDGPITDGLVLGLPRSSDQTAGWDGGIIKFDSTPAEPGKPTCNWFLGSERKFTISMTLLRPSLLGALRLTISRTTWPPTMTLCNDSLACAVASKTTPLSRLQYCRTIAETPSLICRLRPFSLPTSSSVSTGQS